MNTKPFNFCCKRRDLLFNRRNGDIFTCEDNMLFSHVKISCFRGKAHLVFHCCLYNKSFSFKILPFVSKVCGQNKQQDQQQKTYKDCFNRVIYRSSIINKTCSYYNLWSVKGYKIFICSLCIACFSLFNMSRSQSLSVVIPVALVHAKLCVIMITLSA